MASRKFPMTWLCEMANSVLGENGELLEYRHLTANPKTRETWTYSYGNELGRLAQGMPGRVKGTDTIFFIPRQAVPKERTKDVTYGLITCLIRPEKIEEPNRTRYRFYWRPGTQNLADYWTKHHPASHHKSFRPQICRRSRVHQIDYSENPKQQIVRQTCPTDTTLCKTTSCKTNDNRSPRCLIAQRQGCVRLP